MESRVSTLVITIVTTDVGREIYFNDSKVQFLCDLN